MNGERWRRIGDIFVGALGRQEGERSAYLGKACAGDPSLRRQVETLLAAESRVGGFLEDPVHVPRVTEVETTPRAEGSRVGPYRILREVARGGMGVVYTGERADGSYAKQVAIKVIKRGMDSEDIVLRFENERQILAGFEHPNIARLIDGGTSEAGEPYFVMEYVEGEPIDRYCDAARLSISARLSLLRTVCSAVHTAHQSLVVHRDLKPSNILVTAAGEPKLLDFGIAKLLEEGASPGVSSIAGGQRPMTPGYASPEQILGRSITTASDVYSLGVLLYELLTGERPFEVEDGSVRDLERVIVANEPLRPSTRFKQLIKEAPKRARELARSRGAEAGWLRRLLAGDLDTITLLALHREPQRRYRSAQALGEDLERFLRGLPVLARADTWLYRAGKLVRRHALAASFATLVTVLVAVFTLSSWRQHRQVVTQRDHALQVTAFLVDLFYGADPRHGKTPSVRTLLDRGVERIDDLAQTEVKASLLHTLGDVHSALGFDDRALELAHRALALYRERSGSHEAVPRTLRLLVRLYRSLGDTDNAVRYGRMAVAESRRHLGTEHLDYSSSLNSLAVCLLDASDFAEAAVILRRVLALRRRLLGDEHPLIAQSLNNLAAIYVTEGRWRQAEAAYRESLAMRRRLRGDLHSDVAFLANNLGWLLVIVGDLEDAQRMLAESLETNLTLYGEDHRETATSLHRLGMMFQAKGEVRQAERHFQRAIKIRRKVLGAHAHLVDSLRHLGALDRNQDRLSAADARLNEARAMAEALWDIPRAETGRVLVDLAMLARLEGDLPRGESLVSRARAAFAETLPGNNWERAAARSVHGAILTDQGRHERGHALLLEAWTLLDGQLGAASPATREARRRLEQAAGERPQDRTAAPPRADLAG